jgi:hypothetical protein
MELDLAFIARAAGVAEARRGERIQSLWSGYGAIFRAHLSDGTTVVVKWVTPPGRESGSLSYARKCRSYDVETAFYRSFASRCGCRVPRWIDGQSGGEQWLLVLEDLDAAGFAERRRTPSAVEIDRCLRWLAAFHATFLGASPEGLWSTGTYWHLATRPDELAAIDEPALREAAPRIDRLLEACTFRTLVHGDAKLQNFCFGPSGVAAVDFQYVGGGCGMKDLAYFLGSCSRSGALAMERDLLDTYFAHLRDELSGRSVDIAALEREWRALYPIACVDFFRFLAGWAKDYWRADALGQKLTREVLRTLR